MKITVTVIVNAPPERLHLVTDLLHAIGRTDLLFDHPSGTAWTLEYPYPSSDLDVLRREAGKRGLDYLQRRSITLSREDLGSLPFVRIVNRGLEAPLRLSRDSHCDRKNACELCGSGAVLTSPVVFDAIGRSKGIAKPMPYSDSADGCCRIVSLIVARRLSEEHVSGLTFLQASLSQGPGIAARVLRADLSLCGMTQKSSGIERGGAPSEQPCAACGRDGYFDSANGDSIFVYPNGVLTKELPDVVSTAELFGKSRFSKEVVSNPSEPMLYAAPSILVRPKVYHLLRAAGCKNLAAYPVVEESALPTLGRYTQRVCK